MYCFASGTHTFQDCSLPLILTHTHTHMHLSFCSFSLSVFQSHITYSPPPSVFILFYQSQSHLGPLNTHTHTQSIKRKSIDGCFNCVRKRLILCRSLIPDFMINDTCLNPAGAWLPLILICTFINASIFPIAWKESRGLQKMPLIHDSWISAFLAAQSM